MMYVTVSLGVMMFLGSQVLTRRGNEAIPCAISCILLSQTRDFTVSQL